MAFAQVILKNSGAAPDQSFTYRIPEGEDVRFGHMVSVPFGSGNRTRTGYVTALIETVDYPAEKLKTILKVLGDDVFFRPEDLELARWMASRYNATLSSCLSLFGPKDPEKTVRKTRGKKAGTGKVTDPEKDAAPEAEEIQADVQPAADARHRLNAQQQEACDHVTSDAKAGRNRTFLMYGVTGSGKTEVYMSIIDDVLSRGRGAYLLVPEIALTPQLGERLRARFGSQAAILHSRMNDTERSVAWRKIRDGAIRVVAGPRSALFAPLTDPGVIILDEEHELSYKSELSPRYRTHEVASRIASRAHCPLLLGSATPSVESMMAAQQGHFELLRLTERAVAGSSMPTIELVDMRGEMALGNVTPFSAALCKAVRERLAKGEQTILFLNRKGYASFVSCRSCGFVLRCPACYLPYTYHKDRDSLICHHCGRTVRPVTACPECGSRYIRMFGGGTQKIEEAVASQFPKARILRMDADTTAGKAGFEKIYQKIRDGKADIIIGTQMIAKGLDMPNVTLVGVLNADQTLFYPDYHNTERTYQLLTQVAGRAGRAGKAGEVIIQTYDPEHYVLRSVRDGKDEAFYREELEGRRLMKTPPFAHLMQIVLSGRSEEKVTEQALLLKNLAEEKSFGQNVEVVGVSPAQLGRVNNIFRWKLLLRAVDPEELTDQTGRILRLFAQAKDAQVTVTTDLDPYIMA